MGHSVTPPDRPHPVRDDDVRVIEEDVTIPTYRAGRPVPYPLFLDRRVYQGSSGRVYPYPVIDRVADEAAEESHRMVVLENRYLRISVLPAFGGRILSAYDKTNGYPFIYHNHVIKPALVGLAGPWLSGGIEFNWPQHHRPGTYCPVDYTVTAAPDGSRTLWLGETEPMWHLRGVLALTLHPDRAVLSIAVHLSNPTPLPRSFHLWTNPAVHVNDDYQSVFPPDVQAVFDHGKRDVSSFPIARGRYYKVDYSAGVDISWYKHLPVPTSFMAAESRYDFLGGYDHGRGAGVLHVADHHVVPGKKQWVWGCGEFGRAWDRELTDEDGPYAELMCGVFADNQPDFAWLAPYGQKVVTETFFPYKAIGYVRNATVDAAVSLEFGPRHATVGAYATSARAGARVRLSRGDRVLWEQQADLGPDAPFVARVELPAATRATDLRLDVLDQHGLVLVSYSPEPVQPQPLPQPATPIPPPRDVATTDALYLAGQHLEQYRHATRAADAYYREALRRDPDDVRASHALGRWLLSRGLAAEAEPLLATAVRSATRHNPSPVDGEPHYTWGLACLALGRIAQADALFAKAAWDPRLADAAGVARAGTAATRGDLASALACLDQSLVHNARNGVAHHLRAVVLRRVGRRADAALQVAAVLARDPLDPAALAERILLASTAGEADIAAAEALRLSRADASTWLDVAARYAACGLCDEAIALLARVLAAPDPRLQRAPGHDGPAGQPNLRPLIAYACGHYAAQAGRADAAASWRAQAAAQAIDACFPNAPGHQAVLESAAAADPRDATASYLLGLLWYDRGQIDSARKYWERSRRDEPGRAATHRNLAILYFNKDGDESRALRAMRRAVRLSPDDARLLFELDLLEKRCRIDPATRLRRLERAPILVESRDDLAIELATLLNATGRHQEALDLLARRRFHPWEGGEGKAPAEHRIACGRLGRRALAKGRHADAIALFERSRTYPPNLGEGRLDGTLENETDYWLGVAHAAAGDRRTARRHWIAASVGMAQPVPVLYYNDQDPATIAYQGFALLALGRPQAARARFTTLVTFGTACLGDRADADYFAVSLPEFQVFDDDRRRRNEVNGRFLRAFGWWGLGQRPRARRELTRVLALDPAHQAAALLREWGP